MEENYIGTIVLWDNKKWYVDDENEELIGKLLLLIPIECFNNIEKYKELYLNGEYYNICHWVNASDVVKLYVA